MRHRLKIPDNMRHLMVRIELGQHVAEHKKEFAFSHFRALLDGAEYMGTVVAISSHEGWVEYEDGQARRDGNGSLMCDGCEQPFPYAEPVDGKFTCYGCRSFH